jgi:hypothetical protein
MMTTKLYLVALVAAVALLLVRVDANAFVGGSSVSFLAQQRPVLKLDNSLVLRGGAAVDVEDDSEDEFEIESSDEEEEEEEEEEEAKVDPKLAKAALAAASKAKAKAKMAAKTAVSSTLEATAALKPKKKKSSLMKLLSIPYIIKACLNPFVLFQMTKGYWASLFNLDYLKGKVVSWITESISQSDQSSRYHLGDCSSTQYFFYQYRTHPKI